MTSHGVSAPSLRARLARLERGQGQEGRCPDCPPIMLFNVYAGEPEPAPPACPRCGGPHGGEVRAVYASSARGVSRPGPASTK